MLSRPALHLSRVALVQRLCLSLVFLGGAIFAVIWFRSASAPRWNVLLITLDTTRADRLGCYGYAPAQTPRLDQLASQSLLFERAYTVVPITLPAHATLHTGLLPPEHGLRINGTNQLPEAVPTLAAILKQRGYRTGAFVSSLVLDGRFGLGRGFDRYDDRVDEGARSGLAERPANESVSAAISWLQKSGAKPFLCWVHLYDPHEPYDNHAAEFGETFRDRPYDGELAFVDRHVGRLLDALRQMGLQDRTLIIVAGDHGEGLGEHEEATHGYLAYNSTLHIPLMIRDPAQPSRAKRVADTVSLADVFPTILHSLHISPPPGLSGRDLRSGALASRASYAETDAPLMEGGWSPLRVWISDRWKYIQSTRSELFDLTVDPSEQHNLIDQFPAERSRLSQELTEFESTLARCDAATVSLSAQDQRALAGLGYAAGQTPAHEPDTPRRDIKDMILYAEQVHSCKHLIDQQETDRARAILEGVVQSLPDYSKAWGTLGICQAIQGDHHLAEESYRRALALDANQNFARIALGRSLMALDRVTEGADELQAAVHYDASSLEAQYFLGEASHRLRRWDEARTAYLAATRLDEDFIPAHLGLADIAKEEGHLEEAVNLYELVLQRDPNSSDGSVRLAHALVQADREAEAVQVWEDLLHRMPNHVAGLVSLAKELATARDPSIRNTDRAINLAEKACRLTGRRDAGPLMVLSEALASKRQWNGAIEAAEQACAIAERQGLPLVAAEAEHLLESYHARRSDSPR